MAPAALAQVLRPVQDLFAAEDHPDLLVGLGVPDDAAVYRLDSDRALIVTTDFFTPIVDDPYQYGAIAAANALSDVYAMGGRPLLALNIAAIPPELPVDMTAAIMRGLAEKVREAGAVIAGGHTIQDKEPKVGLAAVGIAHPNKLMLKSGARPGDILILSKPLGTGTIATANKNGKASAAHLATAVEWMMRLNKSVAEVAADVDCTVATDITGFGLLGHATEIAQSSNITLEIDFDRLPFLDGAMDYARNWIFPGGSTNNKAAYGEKVVFSEDLTEHEQMLLFDAQTSGGLLIAIPATKLGDFEAQMTQRNTPWWRIGQVIERQPSLIQVQKN